MARKWVRLGGKTGSHVSLAEVYDKALLSLTYLHILYRAVQLMSTEKTGKSEKKVRQVIFRARKGVSAMEQRFGQVSRSEYVLFAANCGRRVFVLAEWVYLT